MNSTRIHPTKKAWDLQKLTSIPFKQPRRPIPSAASRVIVQRLKDRFARNMVCYRALPRVHGHDLLDRACLESCSKFYRFHVQPQTIMKVWVKRFIPPGYGPQVVVLGSIYQGFILGTLWSTNMGSTK